MHTRVPLELHLLHGSLIPSKESCNYSSRDTSFSFNQSLLQLLHGPPSSFDSMKVAGLRGRPTVALHPSSNLEEAYSQAEVFSLLIFIGHLYCILECITLVYCFCRFWIVYCRLGMHGTIVGVPTLSSGVLLVTAGIPSLSLALGYIRMLLVRIYFIFPTRKLYFLPLCLHVQNQDRDKKLFQ